MPANRTPVLRRTRRLRLGNPGLEEQFHDPYHAAVKPRSATRCAQCGAVFSAGRWTWTRVRPVDVLSLCPACRRTNDGYPAGELLIEGTMLHAHAEEIMHLIRNVEQAETAEHPLHRIMQIKRTPGRITVTTTDIHLPRRIGHALEAALEGTLTLHYDERGYFARVRWRRNIERGSNGQESAD